MSVHEIGYIGNFVVVFPRPNLQVCFSGSGLSYNFAQEAVVTRAKSRGGADGYSQHGRVSILAVGRKGFVLGFDFGQGVDALLG